MESSNATGVRCAVPLGVRVDEPERAVVGRTRRPAGRHPSRRRRARAQTFVRLGLLVGYCFKLVHTTAYDEGIVRYYYEPDGS